MKKAQKCQKPTQLQNEVLYVSFCLMKKDRRCESCQAQVIPITTSWMMIHRITRAFVVSDWSLKSASRSYFSHVSLYLIPAKRRTKKNTNKSHGSNWTKLLDKQEDERQNKRGEKAYSLENLLTTNIMQSCI